MSDDKNSKKSYLLSKSTFCNGIQCPKMLFLKTYLPELASPPSPEAQKRMNTGIEVGVLARTLFPGGILIEEYREEAATRTARELPNAHTLFEATFIYDEVIVRIDVLRKDANDPAGWQLIEVKSTTKFKPEHVNDIAIQRYVAERSGLKINSCWLMHINNRAPSRQTKDLLTMTEVTEEIAEVYPTIEAKVKEFKEMLRSKKEPEVKIGTHCEDPRDCDFIAHCWKDVPKLSVLNLYRESIPERFKLYHSGAVKITDPRVTVKNEIAKRMIEVEKAGKRHLNQTRIRELIAEWKYPFYFFDFETMNPAIPPFSGVFPYGRFPIQFSCHIQKAKGAELVQAEYLHPDKTDPRPTIAEAICKAIGETGSVMAFNASFENTELKSLAKAVPKFADRLLGIAARLVDPQAVFRECVYDTGFLGTFSLKTVAPSLLGNAYDYSNLDIRSGGVVEILFLQMNHPNTSPEQKKAIEKSILEYCRLDTLALAKLVEWLYEQAK